MASEKVSKKKTVKRKARVPAFFVLDKVIAVSLKDGVINVALEDRGIFQMVDLDDPKKSYEHIKKELLKKKTALVICE